MASMTKMPVFSCQIHLHFGNSQSRKLTRACPTEPRVPDGMIGMKESKQLHGDQLSHRAALLKP